MPSLAEEPWISSQVVNHSLAELDDCSIAIDATYYLQKLLVIPPIIEPLIPALGVVAAIQGRLEAELELWKAHRITPLFVFDGQSVIGQDEVTVERGRGGIKKTDYAWDLYFNGEANEAVAAFGSNSGAFRVQELYSVLQTLLKARGLHFLVAPFNAAAQVAYLDMVDSDQCAGIMGSLELMLYPINDSVIRSFDWEAKTVQAISKKHITRSLNVTESFFVDGLLMTGTSFLPPFPALLDPLLVKTQPYGITDALNMLRASEKSMALTCTTYHEVVKSRNPNWQDKYRKARMAVNHFVYIAESGEVKVHDADRLTKDNHEYLGLQLPSELFHYLNTGMIGPRVLSWITNGQLQVYPTVDGVASEEYKKLVSIQTVRIKEAALGLLIPRLNRGLGYKNITMKVWYDRNFSSTVWDRHESKANFAPQVASWNITESAIKQHYPNFVHGSIGSEVLALKNPDFVALTLWNPKEKIKGLESAGLIKSICLWRFLHIRGYVNDQHELTRWGTALAAAMSAFEPTVSKYSSVPNLYEALVVAFELLRFELLNARNKHEELRGLPMSGSEEDQTCLLLISRCATLLKLRHEPVGYTGPLNKNLLAFRSLGAEVRSADRDLVDSIVASMFLYAQAKRKRDDLWQLGHELPFTTDPDIALAIAVKTYIDDVIPTDSLEMKEAKKAHFPTVFVPYAVAFVEDLDIACKFFEAIYAGIKTLDTKEISAGDRATWDKAARYLEVRR